MANNTYGRIEGEGAHRTVIVKFHNTDVAEIGMDRATYRTGGWWTVTTKERINRFLPQGWTLSSDHGVWWLTERVNDGLHDDGYPKYKWHRRSQFYNEIWLGAKGDGAFVATPRIDDPDAELRKQISAYVRLYTPERVEAIVAFAQENGLSGDCWFCAMRTEDGTPLGDVRGDDHLLSHIEEEYVMVSLAMNALTEKGYPSPIAILTFDRDQKATQRAIRSYLNKRLLHREGSAA